MQKILPFLFVSLLLHCSNFAQSPQFAVVRPDGTTYICPGFDSAYNKAQNDDFIYLPGVVIDGNKIISKRLTIYGAGHYPDSTLYTGKTIFSGNVTLQNKCKLTGLYVPNIIELANSGANESSFIRVRAGIFFLGGASNLFFDGSVISGLYGSNGNVNICNPAQNILAINCILSQIQQIQNSAFRNCMFTGNSGSWTYITPSNTSFTNCFFKGLFAPDWYFNPSCFTLSGNSSNNCLWTNGINITGNNNYVTTQPDSVLINAPNGGSFDYNYNYHLKSNSIYLTAGDDGTQIGIYGGSSPYTEGAVPNNPHIYFKQVSPVTTNDGKLQINFKVRVGN